nr:sugar phosphate isomerase/epimerase [Deinococcota bacterium]
MQLGIGSFAYAWAIGVPGFKPSRPMTAPHLVARAASLGVQLVQIANNLPLDRLTEAELRELKAQADALGVKVEVGTRGIAPSHLATYLELAEFFASPVIRVVVDTAHHHPDEDEVVGTLGPLMKAFERAGVHLAIENHDRFTADTLARIVARLGSPYAGICLDVINSI